MNLTTPEAKLSAWQAEHTLARIGCTPEYIRHAARNIPRIAPMKSFSDRQVRIARGQPADKPRPTLPGSDPAPTTWEGKVKAARKAVRLVTEQKMELGRALIMAGLHPCYSTVMNQCIAGKGLVYDSVAKGERFKSHDRAGTPFVRWFLDKPGSLSVDDPDNQRLRDAVKASGKSNGELSRATGIHITNLTKFLTGQQSKMLPHNRDRVWLAIGGRK
jgi:hypothetical protein